MTLGTGVLGTGVLGTDSGQAAIIVREQIDFDLLIQLTVQEQVDFDLLIQLSQYQQDQVDFDLVIRLLDERQSVVVDVHQPETPVYGSYS